MRARRALGEVPAAVWLLTALFGMLLCLWSVDVTQLRAPDEAAHLDLVLYLADGHPYPEFDGRYFGKAVGLGRDRHLIDSSKPWPRRAAADAPPRSSRPNVDDLGGIEPDPDARQAEYRRHRRRPPAGYPYVYNQMPQHPPLYHELMAGILRGERLLVPGDRAPSMDRELGLLRLVNALLILPLPLLAWLTADRLRANRQISLLAAVLPIGIPQLAHIGSALNNDNLLALLGGLLAVALAPVCVGERSRRRDLAIGVLLGLSLLTKAFGLVFIPWIVAAYLVGAGAIDSRRRGRREWIERVRGEMWPLVRVGVVGAVVGLWWWVLNRIRTGQFAPTSENLTRTTDRRRPGFDPDAWSYAGRFVTQMAERSLAWIGVGSPKVLLPTPVVVAVSVLVLVAIGVAFLPAREALAAPRRRALAVALLPTVLLVAAVAKRAWGLYVTTSVFAFVQGRYLFATLVPLTTVVAVGLWRLAGRWAIHGAFAVAVALQSIMLVRVLDACWAGDDPGQRYRAMLAWSPWPAAAVGAVTLAVVGLVVPTGLALVRQAAPVEADVDVDTDTGVHR